MTGEETRRRPKAPNATSEDLFLTLANDDNYTSPAKPVVDSSEKPKPRIGPSRGWKSLLASPHSRRPTSTPKAESSPIPSPATRNVRRRDSEGTRPSSTRSRLTASQSHSHAQATPESSGSDLTIQSTVQNSDLAAQEWSRLDGSRSVVSTTAPSTVWDELDELKSRIRRLERGDQESHRDAPKTLRDGSTNIYMERGGEPTLASLGRRAVSTPTTVTRLASPHPLLASALYRTKPLLEPVVYQSLENSVLDALDLTSTLHRPSDSSVLHEPAMLDIKLRQTADNMCRSLTELCIALCEDRTTIISSTAQPRHHNLRPTSPDQSSPEAIATNGEYSPLNYLEQRRTRLEALSPHPSSRLVGARSESRRTIYSERDSALSMRNRSTMEANHHCRAEVPRQISASAHTLPHSRFSDREEDGSVVHEGGARAPSRAVTEVDAGTRSRYSPKGLRDFSREYTSRHPLPEADGVRQRLMRNSLRNASNFSLNSTKTVTTYVESPSASSPPDGGGEASRARLDRAPSSSTRSPLLAERIEERRQQRVATASQLGSIASGGVPRPTGLLQRPGSGRGELFGPSIRE